jgi:aryl-alcohol dehydrogenase-like predicted oxidoreductase
MKTRQLGRTDMEITPIGFGSWAIGGGGWIAGWGPQDDQQAINAMKRALDLGLNWIDTAAVYGLGHSEELVGRAIKGREQRPYVFTKCSRLWNNEGDVYSGLKADSIKREAEASLKRLQVDVIDLYQMHWPSPEQDIEEGWTAMAQLKEEGKVRYIGVSNFNVEQMQRVMNIAPIDSLQPPYSLMRREAERELFPFCLEHNIGVIVYSPMESGLLTGSMTRERIAHLPDDDWRKHNERFEEPQLSRNLALAEKLNEIGFTHNLSAGIVAIAWTLRHPAVTAAIVGARNPEQIENLLPAAEFRLSDAEMAEIDEFLEKNRL